MLWQHNRCIIPVTGFYEPHRLPNGKAQYYYTTLKDQELFSIAGLWDEWTHPQTGEKVLSFVLITTEANAMMRKIHNGGGNPFRMPKILTQEQEKRWLDPSIASEEAVAALLTVYPEKGDDSMARAAEVQLRRPLRRRNYRAGRGNADARTLNAKLHDIIQKERRPITASPPAMSRVTLLIYELCQCIDEQSEELLGRQRVGPFPEYAVHLRP